MAKDGVVYTPYPNGTFLNGITRQRVIQLLRDDGITVVESTLRYEDFAGADEIFISGNYSKVMPVLRIDSRDLQPGPFYRLARELYWAFAHDKGVLKGGLTASRSTKLSSVAEAALAAYALNGSSLRP